MTVVTITRVESVQRPDAPVRFELLRPAAGSQSDIYALDIYGRVLEGDERVSAVDIIHGHQVIRTVPAHPSRAAARHPSGGADEQGRRFSATVGVVGLPVAFRLRLEAVMDDGARTELARIEGRRQPLPRSRHPALNPLVVTSLGRSGTTWLMRLLSEHPHVVTQRAYPYEVRVAGYWMQMLRVLTEPANRAQSSRPDNVTSNPWWIGHNPYYLDSLTHDPRMRAWYGKVYVEKAVDFAIDCIDDFYTRLAMIQGQEAPRLFCEKLLPYQNQDTLWDLYQRPREILLVRDFRDVISSVLAFNKRRGYQSFGREHAQTDEEYVTLFRNAALQLLEYWQRNAARVRLLRYEDLIADPRGTLAQLFDDLELENTDALRAGVLARASADTPQLEGHRTSSSPSASIGRWRTDLPLTVQARCEELLGDTLAAFGYDDAYIAGSRARAATVSLQPAAPQPVAAMARPVGRPGGGPPSQRRVRRKRVARPSGARYVAPLPPLELMVNVGSPNVESFLAVGDAWAQVISKFLRSDDTILDIGCGCGRIARFLINLPDVQYIGFDILEQHVEWCRAHLTPLSGGRFRFAHLDVKSGFYSPGGLLAATECRFPAADASVDLVFAASVFTHLTQQDAQHYLEETRRVLNEGGRAVFSIHINPQTGTIAGDESRIDVEPDYFVAMAERAGLTLRERIGDVCGQELFLFGKAAPERRWRRPFRRASSESGD